MSTAPDLRRYVATVAGTGAVAVLAGASRSLGQDAIDPIATTALFGAAVLSSWIPLRFEHRGGVQGFTLEEGVFIAMLFTLPSGLVPLLLTVAAAIGYGSKIREPVKVAFNVGQIAVWSAASTVVFHLIDRGHDVLSVRSLFAALAAVLTLNVVSSLLMAQLFKIIQGRSRRSTVAETWRLNAVTALGNASFGLLLAFVAREDPLATILASTLMLGLYLGYRGYAGGLEERSRADRMQTLTRTLADLTTTEDPFARFLDHIGHLFGAGACELTLIDEDSIRVVRWADEAGTPGGVISESSGGPTSGAADEAVRGAAPVLLAERDGQPHPSLEGSGHRVAIAAPLRSGTRTVGALVVYDRHGLEPWDESDTVVLATLANETVVALRNVELIHTLESERRSLEEESRKLGDIVGAASDGIAMITPEGQVTAWNGAMGAIVGLDPEEALGKPWYMALRLRAQDGTEIAVDGNSAFHEAIRGEHDGRALDIQALRRDGAWRWLTVTFSPVRRGDTTVGTVLVARDITAEREVDELKADFVATVSHELRTPLTPIWGFLETLSAHAHQLDTEQTGMIITGMRNQLVRLSALVDDLLVVADLDRGAVSLNAEPMDVAVILEAAIAREDVEGRHVRLVGDVRASALGDRQAVLRIVRGMINNALKHTDSDVELSVERDRSSVLIHVTDHGEGVAPWDQERIFQRFGRLGDHLHRTQGPGLGLAIAKALAQQLGGDVTIRSDVGRGSTFTLQIPAAGPRAIVAPNEHEHTG